MGGWMSVEEEEEEKEGRGRRGGGGGGGRGLEAGGGGGGGGGRGRDGWVGRSRPSHPPPSPPEHLFSSTHHAHDHGGRRGLVQGQKLQDGRQ